MHKKIFFGLLILYIVLPLQAQYVVKGKIVDIKSITQRRFFYAYTTAC